MSDTAGGADKCRLFASFFEVPKPQENPDQSNFCAAFRYTRGEMAKFGTDAGWQAISIGPWNHPRGQHLIEFRRWRAVRVSMVWWCGRWDLNPHFFSENGF